jgi:hypothetical protein
MSNLRQRPDGRWAEALPDRCPKGHRTTLYGWLPCRCGGHRSVWCEGCQETVLLVPAWGERCRQPRITAPGK